MVDIGGARMIEVGTELPTKVFAIDRDLLTAYADASGDQNPIHRHSYEGVRGGHARSRIKEP